MGTPQGSFLTVIVYVPLGTNIVSKVVRVSLLLQLYIKIFLQSYARIQLLVFLEILRLYNFLKKKFLYYKHNINFYIAK